MPPKPSSSKKLEVEEPSDEATEKDDDGFIALASGLELGSNEDTSDYRVGLLTEWLLGEIGSTEVRPHLTLLLTLIFMLTFCVCADATTGTITGS